MKSLCNFIDIPSKSSPPSFRFSCLPHQTKLCPSRLPYSSEIINFRTGVAIISKPPSALSITTVTKRVGRIRAVTAGNGSPAALSDIDMVENNQGIFTPKQNKVVVLWDLDNKPPRGSPYEAAMALRRVANRFGDVIDISAYANRHAFIHLPQRVLEERRERKRLDILERKGLSMPSDLYVCGVCGRKCKTNLDLKKHFKQLHEREREKKLSRMRSLKGKKRQRYKEKHISGNEKYIAAARSLITPKVGYGLASELRRAGVFVKTVEDKPQAADWALKRQMQHSMSRGIDWLFLVSDDSDFSEMLRRARDANLRTVVVGDRDRALGRHADLWVPWTGVENGEISEEDLELKNRRRSEEYDEIDEVQTDYGLDSIVDELVSVRTELNGLRISAFSEGEEEDDYLLSYSEDEEEDDDSVFLMHKLP